MYFTPLYKLEFLSYKLAKENAIALLQYIADEDKLEKLQENQHIIKTPVVRNGRQATLGYQPDVWKKWE